MISHATVERLSMYVDAALPPPERQQVEAHLRVCADCRQRLDGLRRVVDRLERLPLAAPPGDLGDRIHRRAHGLRGRAGWSDSLAHGLQELLTGPPLIHVFAVVLALAAIVYLFAFGVSRRQDRPTRIVLPAGAAAQGPAPEAVSPAAEAQGESLHLLGGVFYRVGGVWVERGLQAGQQPDDSLRLTRAGAAAGDPELAALAALDAPLRLRVGQRVVEIAFEDR